MKRIILCSTALVLAFGAFLPAFAQSPEDARQQWLSQQKERITADAAHKQAKHEYANDKTSENEQAVIDTAKTLFHEVLDEVEAWLVWKDVEAEEANVPDNIKQSIKNDVTTNKDKIADLRKEVDAIETTVDMTGVYLKMIKSYSELLADVARNSGSVWVHVGEKLSNKLTSYEIKLRDAAMQLEDNAALIDKLDAVKAEISEADTKITLAKFSYEQVKTPGSPFIKFSEGNTHLKQAKQHLQKAFKELEDVFYSIVFGDSLI